MKKTYEAPSLEVVKFQYRDQVVAASGQACINKYVNENATEGGACTDPTQVETYQG